MRVMTRGAFRFTLGIPAGDLHDIAGDKPEGEQQQQAEKEVGGGLAQP